MNDSKLLALAAAAIVTLLAAYFWAARDRSDRVARVGDLVLPGLSQAINEVTEIRVAKGDGQRVTLVRGANGWEVTERGYAADTGRLRKLILDLAALKIREEKTSDPANYSKLGVEDAAAPTATSTRIDVVSPKRTWSILIGKQDTPRTGFARVADQATSVLAEPLVTADSDPTRWLDRQIVDIPAKEIQAIVVTPPTGEAYVVQKAKADEANYTIANLPAGAQLASPAAPNGIAEAFAGLTFNDVRKTTATAKPTARATVKRFDGKSLEFVGARDGDRTYLAAVSGDPAMLTRLQGWEYELPAWKFEQIFKPRAELLAK